jgi:hypothetical protein
VDTPAIVRRTPIVVLFLSSLAVAVIVGGVLGRATHASGPVRAARAAVVSVARPAPAAVAPARQLQGPLRPLRESLAELLRRRLVRPRAPNARAIAPTTCAVADTSCSLHPCVEFATAAPSPAVAMLSSTVVAVRRTAFVPRTSPVPRTSSVYRNVPSVRSRNRYCRAVPASGQTRLVPVALRP